MADIQEAVSQREEEVFLAQWLADSEGADADPFQPPGEPHPTASKAQDSEGLDETLGRASQPNLKSNEQPAAPVEEHFPYLPLRTREENFNYRPGLSVIRQPFEEWEYW